MAKTFNFNHYIKALSYALNGLRVVFKNEPAFRLELLIFIILAPVGFWLGNNGVQRALMIASIFLVLIVELINSAIETVVDRIGVEQNILSGQAKDIASAVVLMSIINAAVVWLLIIFF